MAARLWRLRRLRASSGARASGCFGVASRPALEDLRRSHEDGDDLVGAKRGHGSQGFVCFLRRFLRLAEYLSGLLKRALAKFARKEAEAVTECRVFTEEGPLLIEIWLASSFQSLFSRNPLA